MITIDNFRDVLLALGFQQSGDSFEKHFPAFDRKLAVDFAKKILIYPAKTPNTDGITINERQTCNFSSNENFVVFECVCRLLDKGYKPEHIELEPRWQVGGGASGGRADILVRDHSGNSLLIIECKTAGTEFNKHWKKTEKNGDQLFSYARQEPGVGFVCLYTSDWIDERLTYLNHLITLKDNDAWLSKLKEKRHNEGDYEEPLTYKNPVGEQGLFNAWSDTYQKDYATKGIFEKDIEHYNIGKTRITLDDLSEISSADIQAKHHEFATILRKHNVSGRENAFDKLINLFLCKVTDEQFESSTDGLQFYWKGIMHDDTYVLQDRLQALYQKGMKEFLKEDITHIENKEIDEAFWPYINDQDATKQRIKLLFKQLKFFTNNDFAFIEVHNEELFEKNSRILREIVRLFQDVKLKSNQRNQFLGDMFEIFLDQGIKQSEGQFFTPMPITRFIIASLPLEQTIIDSEHPPRCLDYACGAGHFLNELASQITPHVAQHQKGDIKDYYKAIEGVEKEYRLSKVAKVSAFMYGQDDIKITYADALSEKAGTPQGSYSVLVANPPYSVKGFLETLEAEQSNYTLTKTVQNVINNNSIETFFIERAEQLLQGNGIAGIIFPSSILSNADATYTAARAILLKSFDIVAICEFGSGTFGKTGTNTVTLFLRRKAEQPQPAEHYRNRIEQWFTRADDQAEQQRQTVFADEHFIKQYCEHIEVTFDDYKTLLAGDANQTLLETEMFAEYQQAFEKLTITKQRRKQKSFKALEPVDQALEMRTKLNTYMQGIEREKLYFFVLASINANNVVIVKSPSGTKEMKAFLGYEWSNAKGNEGIKLATDANGKHITPLYDEDNPRNPDKINYYIEQAFLGESPAIPEHLQPFVSTARLVDMLDFSRTDFNKQITLSPQTKQKIDAIPSKYNKKKLSNICHMQAGKFVPASAIKDTQDDGLYPCYGGNGLRGYTTTFTHEGTYTLIGRQGALCGNINIATGQFHATEHAIVVTPNSDIDNIWLHHQLKLLNLNQYATGVAQPGLSVKKLLEVTTPVPPLDVQQKIVQECEAVDSEYDQAQQAIKTAQHTIANLLKQSNEKEYKPQKLENICSMQAGKFIAASGIHDTQLEGLYPCYGGNGLRGYTEIYNYEGTYPLIGRQGALCGNVNMAYGQFYATEHAVVVISKPNIDTYWLFYQLKELNLNQYASGVAQPGLAVKKLLSISTPVPSLEEQQTLVEKITKLETEIKRNQAIIDGAADRKAAIVRKYL